MNSNNNNIKSYIKLILSPKYLALLMLILQNTFLVVLMHYSRIKKNPDGSLYKSSTAVLVMELLKLITCLVILYIQSNYSLQLFYKVIKDDILLNYKELILLSVPSILYSIQNNLLYYALSHLDATTFQLGYQVSYYNIII